MPKRRNENKEEKKWRKIRKLQEKISKYKDRLTSSDPEAASIFGEGSAMSEKQEEETNVEEQEELEQEEILEGKQAAVLEEGQVEDLDQENLSPDILKALGKVSEADAKYSEEIKPEIVQIIEIILIDGLSKESYEELGKTCKIPKNTKLLDAPRLNPEFTGILSSSITNRDKLLMERQQDVGNGTALICNSINALTNKEFNKIEIIKMLSDSIRLLGNLHHQYTLIRRKMITPFLDKSLMQNLNQNKRSEFLHSKLEESIKTSSAMKRTINVLKLKPKNYQNPRVGRQNQQYKTAASNSFKAGSAPTYKQPRNPPRPAPPPSPTNERPHQRRPMSSNRGGRARYP